MKEFKYVIKDPIGLHARPAGLLAKQARTYNSRITISCGDRSAPLQKLMAVMTLAIRSGEEVTVSIEGDDEETAYTELQNLFSENL